MKREHAAAPAPAEEIMATLLTHTKLSRIMTLGVASLSYMCKVVSNSE
jgi:hypothetical protein